MNNANEPMYEFLEKLREALAPYNALKIELEAAFEPLIKRQRELSAIIDPAINNLRIAFEPIVARIKEIEQQHGCSFAEYLQRNLDERHKVLEGFGWFYAFGISDDLADEVFDAQDTLTQEEADAMMIDYFKENDCAELSGIVEGWSNSPHFISRKHIFNEAMANHSMGNYYSSVTLLSVHTEGVISDYIRNEANARFKLENCIRDLQQLLSEKAEKAYYPNIERKTLFDFLMDIYNSDFWYENPELMKDPEKNDGLMKASYNLSRNKIVHGHVISGLSEADSIKCFLYLNAIFHLLIELDRGDDNE